MPENLAILRRVIPQLGLHPTEQQFDQFETYFQELVSWNNRFNLTAITDYEKVQLLHFVDSLSLAGAGVKLDGCRIIDVGSGAGFPGLPLKIVYPRLRLTLLEANQKKAAFLKHMSELLGLSDISVLNVRAEEAAHQPFFREQYDIAVARAVAPLNTLCELTLPFCRPGGWFIALKKGSVDEETASAEQAVDKMGGRFKGLVPVTLEGLQDNRYLVVIEKICPTPEIYPRRSGVPSKKPLG